MLIRSGRFRWFLLLVAFLLVPASGLAQPVAESSFDSGAEEWTTDRKGTVPQHVTSGGRPGGYVEADAQSEGEIWFWEAPSAFTGDLSAAYNGAIRFELMQSATETSLDSSDVILEGENITLTVSVANPPDSTWTPYRIPLRPAAGWRLQETGETPSATQMETVLGALQALRIRGNYWSGSGTVGLDNVRLQAAQTIERWVDPTQTYLQPDAGDNPRDAVAINLANLGLNPGDEIRLTRLGEFDFDPTEENTVQTAMVGVFSGSDVLEGTSQENRVPDAIGVGQNASTLVTGIPEDFPVNGSVLQIPQGATHLFLSPDDGVFGDNTDPDGDFRLRITRPGVPSGLAVEVTSESASLSWSASAFSTISEYRIYRSTAPIDSSRGPRESDLLTTTAAGDLDYVDGDVSVGETYYYRLTAVDGAGNESAFSRQVAGTPGTQPSPPIGVKGEATGDSSVVVQWDASSSADVQRYRLYRDTESIASSDRSDASLMVDSTSAGTTVYEDVGLAPGQTYHYRVTAVDTELDESDFSTETTARPPRSMLAVPDSVRTVQGGTATIDVLANDLPSRASIDTSSVRVPTRPAHGSITVTDTGTVAYTHDGSDNFVDAFPYVVDDESGTDDTTAVVLSVAEVTLTTSRETVNFGRQQVGAPAATAQLEFKSTGDTTATGLTLSLDNDADYSILDDSGEETLPVGSARTVRVGFRPDTAGAEQTATLTMTSDTGLKWSVDLTGAGVGAEVAAAPETGGVASLGRAAPVSVTPQGPFEPTSRRLYARPGGGQFREVEDASQIPSSLVTSKGVDYYVVLSEGDFRVVVPGGTEAAARRDPFHLPVQFGSLSTPLSPAPSTYRMVSVPAKTDVKEALRSSYGKYDRTNWRALRWDPRAGENGSYREFPAIDTLRPGSGLWLITASGDGFDLGAGQTVDASGPYEIPLKTGWNQIGTPFNFAVPWDTVQAASGLSGGDIDRPVAYRDSAGYQPGRTMLRPWEGYFVFNATGSRDTLVVPPVGVETEKALRASAGPAALSGIRFRASPENRSSDSLSNSGVPSGSNTASGAKTGERPYTLQVGAATEGERRPHRVWLGLRSSAREGRDALDFAQAPPLNRRVRISVLEKVAGRMMPHTGSFKPPRQSGRTWMLLLSHRADRRSASTGSPQEVRLRLKAEGAPPKGQRRYVLDLDGNRRLAPGTAISLEPGEQRRLKVIVGTKAYAQNKSEGISLGEFDNELRSNYPNPFSEETTLTYVLAEEAKVTLEIFNVLGQQVRTLVQERKDAGVHHIRWKGRNQYGHRVGSGIYFYRMQVGDFTKTRKMVLVR